MSEEIRKQQNELAKLIERHSGQDGVYKTVIPSLFFIRYSNVTEPVYRIYKLENGQIKEKGTHEQLMREGGAYSRLFNVQNLS